MVITRSHLDELTASDFFLWSTGIEDTFITDPHRKTGRTLDEYALTQHYELWQSDIELIGSLGVGYARYGLPWHRIEPRQGEFDFSWADQTLNRMLELGVQPIVDLMHYGTPPWLQGGFGNPAYPERVAHYARQIAERFRGKVFWYTPLNEPRITAHYCGRLGWWPPYRRGWRGFLEVMVAVCKGIVLTQRALREIDPEIVCAHVDATDIYQPADLNAKTDADLRQSVVFLALDLVSGRVDAEHELYTWLLRHGVLEEDLAWFRANAVELDVIGLNLYPMFTNKIVTRTGSRTRTRMKYGSGQIIDRLGDMYWERYRRPMFISETAAIGARRQAWMADSFDATKRLRKRGIPMVGYTWWPLFALVGWAYRESDLPFDRYLLQLGLWDLVHKDGKLVRTETDLVGSYRAAVAAGCERVGDLEGAS